MPDRFRDPRLWIGLAAVVIGARVLAPDATSGLFRVLPLAACPLMMIVMMKAMTGGATRHGSQERQPGAAGRPDPSSTDRQLADLRAEVEALKAERVEPPLESGSGPSG